jgi:hypothetical protein
MVYKDLAARVEQALEAGRLTPQQVERLLAEARTPVEVPGRATARDPRPGVAGVLAAMGVLVAYLGVSILYGLQWSNMGQAAQTLTPFVFPGAALVAAVVLHRVGRPRWESELAGIVGFVALALAFLVAAAGLDPADGARYGGVAGLIGLGVVIALHTELRSVRLTGWGLSGALVALTGSFAAEAGAHGAQQAALVAVVQAAIAAGICLAARRSAPEAAVAAARTALLLAYLASVIGQDDIGYGTMSGWTLLLTVAVAAAFLLSTTLELGGGLVWVGTVGALIWLGMVAAAVGSSAGWAITLVLGGFGLVGLSLLVAALRKRPAAIS